MLGRLFIEHKGELALAVALSVSQVACNSQSPVESETTSQVRQVSQEQFRAGIVVHGSGASNTEEALTPAIADQYLRVETAERKLLERAEAATFTDGEREHSYMKVRPLVLPTHPVHDKIGEFDRHHLGWPIAAMQGERILVLYTAEECHAGKRPGGQVDCNRGRIEHAIYSDDRGEHWSSPVNLRNLHPIPADWSGACGDPPLPDPYDTLEPLWCNMDLSEKTPTAAAIGPATWGQGTDQTSGFLIMRGGLHRATYDVNGGSWEPDPFAFQGVYGGAEDPAPSGGSSYVIHHDEFGYMVFSGNETGLDITASDSGGDETVGWLWKNIQAPSMDDNDAFVASSEPSALEHEGNIFVVSRQRKIDRKDEELWSSAREAYQDRLGGLYLNQHAYVHREEVTSLDQITENDFTNRATNIRGNAYSTQPHDTPSLIYNPISGRIEILDSHRYGGGPGDAHNWTQRPPGAKHCKLPANNEPLGCIPSTMTSSLNLWSILPSDLLEGKNNWRFEGTLLKRIGAHSPSNIASDGLHPAGSVVDMENEVEHIFVYSGQRSGEAHTLPQTGIFHITRTLHTEQLSQWLRQERGPEDIHDTVARHTYPKPYDDVGDIYELEDDNNNQNPRTDDFTVALNFKVDSLFTSSAPPRFLLSKGNANSSKPGYSLFIKGSSLCFRVGDGVGKAGRQFDLSPRDLDEYVHVTGMIDRESEEVRLFIDGVEKRGGNQGCGGATTASLAAVGSIAPTEALMIGGVRDPSSGVVTHPAIAKINDVRVFERKLDPTVEVPEVYATYASWLHPAYRDAVSTTAAAPYSWPQDFGLRAYEDHALNMTVTPGSASHAIGFLVRLDGVPASEADDAECHLLAQGNRTSVDEGYSFGILDGSVLYFRVADENGSKASLHYDLEQLDETQWHHVLGYIDRTDRRLRLLINGRSLGVQPGSAGASSWSLPTAGSRRIDPNNESLTISPDSATGYHCSGKLKNIAVMTNPDRGALLNE